MKKIALLSCFLIMACIVNSQPSDKQTLGSDFQVGNLVEVWDPIEKGWFPSSILKNEPGRYYIHFTGYDAKWDTWVTPERVRQAGSGKKNDPAPIVNNQNPESNSNTTTAPASGIADANEVNIDMPTLVPGKNITIKIGDPFLYTDPATKQLVKLFVTNLEYQDSPDKHKYYATYNNNGFYFWSDMLLDPSFNYSTLPEKATISINDTYKIGDLIETHWTWNERFDQYEIKPAIIVSADGDNYYVYFNEKNNKSEHFEWRYVSDLRSIGSAKKIELIPQYGSQGSDYANALSAMANCSGNKSAGWDFLWYYRHDMYDYNGPLSTESNAFSQIDLLKGALSYYECMSQAISPFPNTGNSGRRISNRLDVQYNFLKNYKTYIKKAFDTRINILTQNFVSDVRNGFYTTQLARSDGKDMIKLILTDQCKTYEQSYALASGKIEYPFKDLEAAYDFALPIFLKEKLETNDGLVNNDHAYKGKDARVEQLCIAHFKQKYPGSQALMSGCYDNEYLVVKNSLGVPDYRTKTVLAIFQGPLFRTKVEALFTLREEYLGNGKYGNPSFPRGGSMVYLK